LLDRIAVVVASSELPAGKPDPRAFTALCQRLGTTAGSVMFVGDDPLTDVAGARSAGLQAVLLDRAHEGRAPDGVTSIRSLTELPAVLSGVNSAADGGSGAAGCRS
jgi:putative hydrolase of the HAD superfamily